MSCNSGNSLIVPWVVFLCLAWSRCYSWFWGRLSDITMWFFCWVTDVVASETGLLYAVCRLCCQSSRSSSEGSLEAGLSVWAGQPPSTTVEGEPAQGKGQITGKPLPLICSWVLHCTLSDIKKVKWILKGKKKFISLAPLLSFSLNCIFSYAFISNIC